MTCNGYYVLLLCVLLCTAVCTTPILYYPHVRNLTFLKKKKCFGWNTQPISDFWISEVVNNYYTVVVDEERSIHQSNVS